MGTGDGRTGYFTEHDADSRLLSQMFGVLAKSMSTEWCLRDRETGRTVTLCRKLWPGAVLTGRWGQVPVPC